MTRHRIVLPLAALAVVAGAAIAGAAVTAAPGWAVRTIPVLGAVQGGVVRRGPDILVGQGGFGAGLQQIVRVREDGSATTVATGFNSLGGFDLAADGTLYVVDNGGNLAGATTGDTVFAIPQALTRTTAVTAAGHEVVPAGSITAGQDVVLAPDTSLYVTDAVGIGLGRVVRIVGGVVTPFAAGLDYTAGAALGAGGTLLVGNVDAGFAGALLAYPLAGGGPTSIATGLSGIYAMVRETDGTMLVSGGFTGDFSSSTIVAVDPAPPYARTERAHGFGFSSEMFHDADRDETLVLDYGATAIVALCRERDGDGLCDADDPCTFPVAVGGAKIALAKLGAPAGDEKLALKGELVVPTSPALDPIANGAHLRIESGAGVVADVVVPGGAFDVDAGTGWKLKKTTWSWKGNVGGVTRVSVKADPDAPGHVTVKASGKGGGWAVDGVICRCGR
ncbi:MAG: hypothetical protein U0807_13105 [Candidatus Binatia bacterium]